VTSPLPGEFFHPDPSKVTVVTSTRRLARALVRTFDEEQIAAGRQAWEALDILPWDAWVDRSWRRLREGARWEECQALSDEQEAVLWELAARESGPVLDRLLMPAQIAREALRAWRLVENYGVPSGDLQRAGGPETRQLLQIADRVESRLRQEGWRSRNRRLRDLTGSGRLGSLGPTRLVLAGFDELTPTQDLLISALRDTGVDVAKLPAPSVDSAVYGLACADPSVELEQLALAARGWLEKNPQARIGIVMADLEQRRREIAEILEDVLTPERLLPGSAIQGRAWDISLGPPLSDWPIVDTAIRALSLAIRPGSFSEISLLLRSPFVGASLTEAGSRGLLDRDLRSAGVQQLDLGELSTRLESGRTSGAPVPDLAARLSRLAELVRSMPGTAAPDRWAGLFGEMLKVLGWPGERPLDSAEYQCRMKWQQLLATLAATGIVSGRVTASACLDRLRRLAADTSFQPEGAPAPIQVLGLLETPGLTFDALWIAGFHHQAWPRPVRPNALIPARIQRRYRMPRAAPDLELQFAKGRTETLCRAAGEVVFSWPEQLDDESLRPSPLLRHLPGWPSPSEPRTKPADRMLGHMPMETLNDNGLQAWTAGKKVTRGSYLVKDMSACPFRAQARARLDAGSLEQPRPGISAMDSGAVAHLALQALWEDWRDSESLACLNEDQLIDQVRTAVRQACQRILPGRSPMDQTLRELETARTIDRLVCLLAQDRGRAAFAAVRIEKSTEREFAGVRFRLQADRVDKLADGSLLLIDYKTGSVNLRDWHGERPRDPQLPFYALMFAETAERIGGLAYGCLRTGEEGYIGLAAVEISGTGIRNISQVRSPPNDAAGWDQALSAWERNLETLVGNFAAGDARVDPRRMSEDCRFCDLSPLCRRHELVAAGVLRDE
jgi:probable DNA repair protein